MLAIVIVNTLLLCAVSLRAQVFGPYCELRGLTPEACLGKLYSSEQPLQHPAARLAAANCAARFEKDTRQIQALFQMLGADWKRAQMEFSWFSAEAKNDLNIRPGEGDNWAFADPRYDNFHIGYTSSGREIYKTYTEKDLGIARQHLADYHDALETSVGIAAEIFGGILGRGADKLVKGTIDTMAEMGLIKDASKAVLGEAWTKALELLPDLDSQIRSWSDWEDVKAEQRKIVDAKPWVMNVPPSGYQIAGERALDLTDGSEFDSPDRWYNEDAPPIPPWDGDSTDGDDDDEPEPPKIIDPDKPKESDGPKQPKQPKDYPSLDPDAKSRLQQCIEDEEAKAIDMLGRIEVDPNQGEQSEEEKKAQAELLLSMGLCLREYYGDAFCKKWQDGLQEHSPSRRQDDLANMLPSEPCMITSIPEYGNLCKQLKDKLVTTYMTDEPASAWLEDMFPVIPPNIAPPVDTNYPVIDFISLGQAISNNRPGTTTGRNDRSGGGGGRVPDEL